MGARLVGHHVGLEPLAEQLGEHLSRVRAYRHGQRPALALRPQAALHRVGQVVCLLVEVARLEPAADPLAVHLHAQRDALVHRHRQRLGPAHPAEPRGERDRPGERAVEAPPRDLGEALVRALHDPLAPDVDPGAGGHLAVHRQPEILEPAELVPRGPLRHEIRVRDQHARRPLVRAEHADRLAGLDQHRLVVAEAPKGAYQRVERLPRPRRTARAAVDHEVVGPLGHVRVEVVHQHPHRGLLRPAPAGEVRAARRVHLACAASLESPYRALNGLDHRARGHEPLDLRQLGRQEAVRAGAGHRGRGRRRARPPCRRRARAARGGRARGRRR